MDNDSEEITASEINKFTYCNYQWYYERLHGRKYIGEARRKMLSSMGYTDSSKSNFVKGIEFHTNYDDRVKSNIVVKILIVVFVIIMIVAMYMLVMHIHIKL